MIIFCYVALVAVQNDRHCSLRTIMRFSQIIFCLCDNVIISPNGDQQNPWFAARVPICL